MPGSDPASLNRPKKTVDQSLSPFNVRPTETSGSCSPCHSERSEESYTGIVIMIPASIVIPSPVATLRSRFCSLLNKCVAVYPEQCHPELDEGLSKCRRIAVPARPNCCCLSPDQQLIKFKILFYACHQ